VLREGANRRVVREHGGEKRSADDDQHADRHTGEKAPPEHPVRRVSGLAGTPRSERPSRHGLRGDGDGVEGEGEEEPDLPGDLVGGERRGAEPPGDRRRHRERPDECRRPDRQKSSEHRHVAQPGTVRSKRRPLGAGGPPKEYEEGGGGGVLRDDRGERGGAHTHAQPVDQKQFQRQVGAVRDENDDEGCDGVLEAASEPDAGENRQEGGRAEQADPQVEESEGTHVLVGGEDAHGVGGDEEADGRHRQSEAECRPVRLDSVLDGAATVIGPETACHDGTGARREEVEDPEARGEHGTRHRNAGQLRAAQVPDDGCVGEHVEGLGHEGPEGGKCQPEDLPVVGAAAPRGGRHSAHHGVAVTPG